MIDSDRTRPSLLIRIRDHHDRVAWGEFVDIYAPLVHRLARRSGLQDADASDLTQDVLRSVAGAIGRLDYDPARGTFRSWIYTVTRHALQRYFESRRRQPPGTGDPGMQAWLEGHALPEHEPPEWEFEYQRRLLDVAAELVRPTFEPATWQAFWATAVEGRTCKDVADALEMSLGAVYIARSRVLGRLRDEVARLEDD